MLKPSPSQSAFNHENILPEYQLFEPYFYFSTQASDIETRIKKKVKDVLPCDVTEANLLLPENIGQFDVITCQLVLETACRTWDAYSKAFQNVSQLVRPDGRLIMVLVFEATHYYTAGKAFFDLPITRDFIEKLLSDNGFENLSFESSNIFSIPENNTQKWPLSIVHASKQSR